MDLLTAASLDWSQSHIQRFGDTDLLPVPFEYDAIRHSWPVIRTYLESRDLDSYQIRSYLRILAPKSRYSFRVATQLDPLDGILYTALIREAAELIERSRIPAERNIACSYRIAIQPDGTFFVPNDGWPNFHRRSEELATSGAYHHVVVADIVDFYNQVYTHRVENAVEQAGITNARAKNIEEFLIKLTARQSRGVPVGPAASTVLTEACLNDVDLFLLRSGHPHVRYVDDFRIFCATRKEALAALHSLAEYLYTAHRLSLQSLKTRIMPVQEFVNSELRDPEQHEEQGRAATLRDLLRQISETTGYEIDDIEPDNGTLNQAIRNNLLDLLRQSLQSDNPHFGIIRHLLRRAARLRARNIYTLIYENLDALSPVMRDVCVYFSKTVSDQLAPQVGERIANHMTASDVGQLPFIQMWCLWLLTSRQNMLPAQQLWALAEAARPQLGLRPMALVARQHRMVDWVRFNKETWRNNLEWDRRAIIWAGAALPRDERTSWLNMIQNSDDVLDKAVAAHASAFPI